jgi:hypothetical protein
MAATRDWKEPTVSTFMIANVTQRRRHPFSEIILTIVSYQILEKES